ncbi:MAG TPA: TIM barrel protein [Burkholderiales bacterium]|nr:TIM barrel protein [Burkholderiales bacterium]
MLKFDANLRWLFTEVPMAERYAAAAQAGFPGVEVAFPYDMPAAELAARLRDNNLKLVQILSPVDWAGGERGLAALPDRVADFRESMRVAVDYAAQVGRPNIHPLAGNLPEGADRERYYETFLENLAFAADLAGKEGITLIIEPVCRARFPAFLFKRLDEGVEIIRKVGRDNIKLCFDTFHVQMEEGALTERLEQYLPWIGHMQIGDTPGRNEPGSGEIRFPYVFEQMERLGWTGWIGCEFAPTGHTLDCLDWGAPYGLHPPPGHKKGERKPRAPGDRQRGWT